MTPELRRERTAAASAIVVALWERGLDGLVVAREPMVLVRTPFHETPVPLHDVDDVRWLAADLGAHP